MSIGVRIINSISISITATPLSGYGSMHKLALANGPTWGRALPSAVHTLLANLVCVLCARNAQHSCMLVQGLMQGFTPDM